jgi:TP901 family phage tail tape measure protein
MLSGFGLAIGAFAAFSVVSGAVGIMIDFEQANANVASVLGTTVDKTVKLQQSAKQLGATTSFTATEVAGLQTELAKLGFTQTEIIGATAATLDLAAATKTELPQAAKQVGAAIRAFGLNAKDSARVSDVFAASTSKSGLNMEFLDTAMSKVAPVAKQFGFSIEASTALLGKLADAGFDASTAATSTRSILLNLADGNGKLAKALGGPVKSLPDLVSGLKKLKAEGIDLASALELTDKRSVAAFATFMENADAAESLEKALKNSANAARDMAAKQLDTLGGSLILLNSAYEGFILSLDDGTGAFSGFLRRVVDVSTEILSLLSGTAALTSTLDENELSLRSAAETSLFWLKAIGLLIGSLIVLKGLIMLVKAGIVIYNVAMGINTAITGKNNIALVGNIVAQRAYRTAMFLGAAATKISTLAQAAYRGVLFLGAIAMKAITAAQLMFNAALTANPIGAVIVAISALVALVILAVNSYDDWGASLLLLMGPFGMIINIIQSFKRNWQMVKDAFTTGGLMSGLKAIGRVLIDSLLMPLQQLLELASNIPGLENLAGNAAIRISEMREGLNVNTGDESGVLPNSSQAASQQTTETIRDSNVRIDVRDKGGNVEKVFQDGTAIPISMQNTVGVLNYGN